jgi:hypothetical protein
VLAWWLCQHTTARRRWVSERLGMGDESRVTQAIGRLKRKGQPKLERLKRRLEQVYDNHNAEVEVRMCEFRDPFTGTRCPPGALHPPAFSQMRQRTRLAHAVKRFRKTEGRRISTPNGFPKSSKSLS